MIRAHQLAALTAFATFVLVLMGNVVWSTGSSLACPDWPTCHGSFVPEMRGGVLYEHSHRLLGAAVGVLTIGTALLLIREKRSRRLVLAGASAVGLVVVQGVLGGLTVLLRLPPLVSVAHLTTAMAFLSLLIWMAWESRPAPVAAAPLSSSARGAVIAAYIVTALQIVLGGIVRHTAASAACPDLPLCPGQSSAAATVHMSHRVLAVGVAVVVIFAAIQVIRSSAEKPLARVLAGASVALVLVQIAIGAFTIWSGFGIGVVTAHMGVGALLLGDLLLLGLVVHPSRRTACVATRGVAQVFRPTRG